ncbi:hypothetical protein CANTEDRAFT_129680 [Yamadazyma tenuis ATCC 10573]|uniref:RSE1/DDB1/CPSF1 second beta-propeller domain-containing protein n=1 Tax=Candida tenuis (strain ATCC 10573 / BCRC 21748 / CBS 615 / JCM 9827 / NBRC 10315 / NRRL Y-1498 / VKM Y-70) TaxID=590646 RepID=G3B0L1_CANTC|nr:uncharacterized protein CANTEDRAFT_129680 [Yamadazyma tenuis ATCC 10573]EGV65420.1 hypothetical protein CANTEDRAFT_129680 [Yamadazyma tenuis ATCC 10573]
MTHPTIAIKTQDNSTIYAKKTLLHSPIFNNIFPHFYVSLHKRIRNIRNLSLQDDDMQYLALQEEDSQFGVFSDDEMLFDIGESDTNDMTEDRSSQKPHRNLKTISVIVRNTSLLVNEQVFPFSAPVRSSCLVKGIRNETAQEEDSLLVSLKSGFLLLIRIFYVPYNFDDTEYNEDFSRSRRRMLFKPFVVQWWDVSSNLSAPSLFTSGYSLTAQSSGLSVVSTSACGGFRIYNCNHTENGVFFQNHETIVVNGSILHSCFAQPIKGSILDNHVMLLMMVLTTDNRLNLNLYGWSTSERDLNVSTLPLDGGFPLPVFIVPLSNNGSFLYVTPDELIIITVHDITSAEYNFRRHDFPGTFPTNFYCPESEIVSFDDETVDEVLVSTDNGTVFSVIVGNGLVLSLKPVVRISDPISLFSLEASGDRFELIYGSSIGLNRMLMIEELLPDSFESPPPYSSSLLLKNYKNWAPLLDVQIIDAYKSKNTFLNSTQELWCLSGIGKRARLSQLRSGYSITRLGDAYSSLRKVESMRWLGVHDSLYLVCTLPFETMLLEYQQAGESDEEELVEVNEASIITDQPTIAMNMISEEFAVQVTPKCILVTSLETIVASRSVEDGIIVMSDIVGNIVGTVSQSPTSNSVYTLELIEVSEEILNIPDEDSMSQDIDGNDGSIDLVCSILVDTQVSFMKLLARDDELFVLVGGFEGTIQIFKFKEKSLFKVFEESLFTYYRRENLQLDGASLVPSDALLIDEQTLLLGTKDGLLFSFSITTTIELEYKKFFKLSDIEVKLSKATDNIVLAICGTIWLVDISKPAIPEPIIFDEKNDRPVKCLLPIYDDRSRGVELSVLLTREEGLSFATVSFLDGSVIRQINVGDSAKKFIHLPHISLFAVLSTSQDRNGRLRFVDRKTFKLLPHIEYNSRNKKYDRGNSMFDDDETPICCKIWSLDKLGRISKKLLIGCSTLAGTGRFKIVDVGKVTDHDNKTLVKVSQLNCFDHPEPIVWIEQVDDHILFASGKSMYSTSYNIEGKRLNPVSSLVSLTSDIISISVSTEKIISVTTKLDSVFQFEFDIDAARKETLQLYARDPSPKSISNHAVWDSKIVVGDKVHSSVIIMDKNNKTLVPGARFKTSGVPRVFIGNFGLYWDNDAVNSKDVISITVDGEVTLFKQININSEQFQKLSQIIPLQRNGNGDLKLSTDKWDTAFTDKVSGKGFKSINKSYFRNKDNKQGLVDYDLTEISKVCHSYISL